MVNTAHGDCGSYLDETYGRDQNSNYLKSMIHHLHNTPESLTAWASVVCLLTNELVTEYSLRILSQG